MIYRLPVNERAAIYTMGRLSAVKGPGFVFVIPVLQTMTRIDVGSTTLDLPSAKVTYHVTDAGKALHAVHDFRDAMKHFAEATLQRVLAGRSKDALIFERRGIEEEGVKAMNTTAAEWGVQVEKVEVKG